ncbi:hypothetical protein DSCO28_41700 [Desulfosarcina ovata subsp. sediminis]|uniref:Uncharacterized protein n=1 Tax=Desulfosarcina ovata subsp. sediminis TaxID=885957 RepID=A0A5K7ZTU7_9BACT|nr:hypothetical protein [Desulfosarcina ovata]BBO83604.1 hypothetical protein DSCO28_41700 [Desulfosarcina ovata subsp. sediminis]
MPEKLTLNPLDRVLAEILRDRASRHVSAGRHLHALPLLRTLVLEFPDDQEARAALVDLYRELARLALEQADRPRAEAYLVDARKLAPDATLSISMPPGEETESSRDVAEDLRRVAHRVIDRHYPDQARWLDLAWRIFHDVDPWTLGKKTLAGALGAVGDTQDGQVAAQVAILLGVAARGCRHHISPKAVAEEIRKAGRQLGADGNLINRLVYQVLEWMGGDTRP